MEAQAEKDKSDRLDFERSFAMIFIAMGVYRGGDK